MLENLSMSLRLAQLVSPSRPPSWTSTQWQLVGVPASSSGQCLSLQSGPVSFFILPTSNSSPLPPPGLASLWSGQSQQVLTQVLPATAKVRASLCSDRPLLPVVL